MLEWFIHFRLCQINRLFYFFFFRKAEQHANPDAAIQAVKYYNYSLIKKNFDPFKPFVTEKAIAEESKEIENILGK